MRVQFRTAPQPDMIDEEWRSPLCDERGRLIVVVEGGGGGGGGDASAANQLTQITALGNILAEVTGAAKDVTVGQVVTAVQGLGDGGTIAELVALLTSDAATQSLVLAELESIDIDTTASAASLVQIAGYLDGVEGLIGTTNTTLAQVRDNATSGANRVAVRGEALVPVVGSLVITDAGATQLSTFSGYTTGKIGYLLSNEGPGTVLIGPLASQLYPIPPGVEFDTGSTTLTNFYARCPAGQSATLKLFVGV